MILAIDTTSAIGSIALLRDGEIDEIELRSPDGFAHVLFPELEALLSRHGLRWRDVQCFAAAAGPGAFTGVRVGLAAAKGLAEATGARVVAVSNLQALASFGTAALRAPVIDARRGDVFGALYDSDLRLVQPEVVLPYEKWTATLPEGAEIIQGERALAAAIARIAAARFAAGEACDPASIDANYVRSSDAELKWKDSR